MVRWFKSLLPGLVLLLALGATVYFVKTRPETPRSEQVTLGTPVEVTPAVRGKHPRRIITSGQVEAERALTVRTELAGRIIQLSPRLREGQRVKRGEVLFALDPRDAESALREAEAGVAQAKVALKEEEARSAVAAREWQARARSGNAKPPSEDAASASAEAALEELALRAPYLASARSRLDAAVAAVGRAKLNLERCRIVAPFDALVLTSDVEIGRVVAPGESLARLASIEAFWVRATLPMGATEHLRFPGDAAAHKPQGQTPATRKSASPDSSTLPGGEDGPSRADVWLNVGSTRQHFQGSALRLSGELEAGSRMAQLIVRVPEPLAQALAPSAPRASRAGKAPPEPSALETQAEAKLPLLLGSFVHVELEAGELEGVFELPRSALRERDQLFVSNTEGRLEFRPATVAWRTPEHVYIASGLYEGDLVVISALASPLPGMPLRIVDDSSAEDGRGQGGQVEAGEAE